jgi:eukaryotic-like serine/threonine-protein kinase
MDEPIKEPKAGLEDEKAFADTLASDPGVAEKPESAPEAKSGETPPAAAKPDSKQPPWVGRIMGHFKLLRLIGEGSMGLVIQAEDIHLKRIVALKVLRKQLATGQRGKKAIEQFIREARAAASIEHPNIVRVYEINQHGDWWYIAMEMVTGNSLHAIVKAAGPLPAARACPIIADAATGLQVAHELGMIHRDIKPGNILVTRNGHGKISDFGLVRVDDPNDPFDSYARQSIGTPYFMAPEIIRRGTIGPAVDIYSLGGTLYYVLTGRPPYTADTVKDILRQHLHADPPNLQWDLSYDAPNLTSLVRRMMAKQPDVRPTAAEVAAILHSEAIAAAPESPGFAVSGGSTLGTEWQGLAQKSGTALSSSTVSVSASPSRGLEWIRSKLATRWGVVSALAILLILCGLAFWLFQPKAPPRQDRRAVSRLFPDAPESYGTRPPGFVPVPSGIGTEVPGFSWKGKVDSSGFRYIAARTGRYFYSIDDKRAILIRADQCVGYPTAEQARGDGKQPAP